MSLALNRPFSSRDLILSVVLLSFELYVSKDNGGNLSSITIIVHRRNFDSVFMYLPRINSQMAGLMLMQFRGKVADILAANMV